MTILKSEYKKERSSVHFLNDLILSSNYLFHITSDKVSNIILEKGTILPLTVDGARETKLCKERGTASFTENPIQIYQEDLSGCFDEKNVVLVFDRNVLKSKGVFPAVYIPEEDIVRYYMDDYKYAPEGADFETEWRSLAEINIEDALKYIIYIPERYYDVSTNSMKFSNIF